MKEPSRRDRAAEETRSRIVAAAADCVVRDGLADVRMAGIAKEAGVSSGLVHYHFDTKEQLFAVVLSQSGATSRELTREALARAGGQPAQRLAAFLDRCLPCDGQLRHDWMIWQELDLLSKRQPEPARIRADLYDRLYASVTDILLEGIASGDFDLPVDDARTVAETVIALCDGIGSRVLVPGVLSLEDARTRIALAVGRLVGSDGPLPPGHVDVRQETVRSAAAVRAQPQEETSGGVSDGLRAH